MTESEIKQSIDQYISGTLTQLEIDQLFIVFLKAPEWFEYYEKRERFLSVKG